MLFEGYSVDCTLKKTKRKTRAGKIGFTAVVPQYVCRKISPEYHSPLPRLRLLMLHPAAVLHSQNTDINRSEKSHAGSECGNHCQDTRWSCGVERLWRSLPVIDYSLRLTLDSTQWNQAELSQAAIWWTLWYPARWRNQLYWNISSVLINMCQILQYVHVDLTVTPNDFIIVSKCFANSLWVTIKHF